MASFMTPPCQELHGSIKPKNTFPAYGGRSRYPYTIDRNIIIKKLILLILLKDGLYESFFFFFVFETRHFAFKRINGILYCDCGTNIYRSLFLSHSSSVPNPYSTHTRITGRRPVAAQSDQFPLDISRLRPVQSR